MSTSDNNANWNRGSNLETFYGKIYLNFECSLFNLFKVQKWSHILLVWKISHSSLASWKRLREGTLTSPRIPICLLWNKLCSIDKIFDNVSSMGNTRRNLDRYISMKLLLPSPFLHLQEIRIPLATFPPPQALWNDIPRRRCCPLGFKIV